MAESYQSGIFRLRKKSTLVPVGSFFVWLDTTSEDFDGLMKQFCVETSVNPCDWKFFDNADECYQFIRAETKRTITLITSGRLAMNIIEDLHNLLNLHSIYVYCNKKQNYESWKNDYKKVRGVFDDPVQLFDQMCQNLDGEVRQSQQNLAIDKDTKLKSNDMPIIIHCLAQNVIKSYYHPNLCWCPWETNNWTTSLPTKGQGTIEILQNESIPFELRISNKNNLDNDDRNSYAIVLKVDVHEVQLSVISAQYGSTPRFLENTTESHQVLQRDDNICHSYWLTFYGKNLMVQYGIGEIRPQFKILEANIPQRDQALMESISYIHVKLNNDVDKQNTKYLTDKLKIFVGLEPIIFDPPLLIISPNEFSPTRHDNREGVLAPFLRNPCQHLYLQFNDFTLNDDTFPNFTEAIERSIKNPNGWCHQKLKEKSNRFGRPKAEASYICIGIDKIEGDKTMYSGVIKIWPPGYYSPIHNHGVAYGIIRVLHGKILIKFFPELSMGVRQSCLIEQLFEANQVTWMMPKLNQISQMKNPDMYGSCCITLHCYQYKTDEQVPCEHFDFITNDGQHIECYHSLYDNTYLTFKKLMMMESAPKIII